MIRIDELYDNTFWPWMQEHLSGVRMFFCDPPGHTSVDTLFNHGSDDWQKEYEYIYLHDQEPVDFGLYQHLFDQVAASNEDLSTGLPFPLVDNPPRCPLPIPYNPKVHTLNDLGPYWGVRSTVATGSIVVSEKGENVKQLCDHYGWRSYYYFWHGWAALDWYRGYNRTFLMKAAEERTPTKTFMSPNRIVGGKRDHRVLFLNEVFTRGLEDNYISAPRVCPEEGVDISTIAERYGCADTFANADLPRTFPGEDTQKMASCWLDNFDAAQDSMFYVPTETVYFGKRLHLTEKTFKPIAMEMPFILVAPAHSLEYLRSYGFQTFGSEIDESYDEEEDDLIRIQKVGKLLEDINGLSTKEKQHLWKYTSKIATHNYQHFYGGKFEQALWQEFKLMLSQIERDHAL
jgi:hypothetical protein